MAKFTEDQMADIVIKHLDLDELLDILSPDVEEVVNGLKDMIYEKQDKILDYVDLDDTLDLYEER